MEKSNINYNEFKKEVSYLTDNCPNYGKKNDDDFVFCKNCGKDYLEFIL